MGGDFGERRARGAADCKSAQCRSFEYGYLALALAQVGQSDLTQAAGRFKTSQP